MYNSNSARLFCFNIINNGVKAKSKCQGAGKNFICE